MEYIKKLEIVNDCHAIDGLIIQTKKRTEFQGNEQTILTILEAINENVLRVAKAISEE